MYGKEKSVAGLLPVTDFFTKLAHNKTSKFEEVENIGRR